MNNNWFESRGLRVLDYQSEVKCEKCKNYISQ